MAKNSIDTIITAIKRRIDYDPQVADTDLDNLLIDMLNDGLKVLNQKFIDYNVLDEIADEDSASMAADQEYVDLAAETVDFDQPISVFERTNDTLLQIISFKEIRAFNVDSTASSSATPTHCAFANNRIYIYPTSSTTNTLRWEYIKLLADVSSGGTLPFENKYDPILIAMVRADFAEYLDPTNSIAITAARQRADAFIDSLIDKASLGYVKRQTSSRKGDIPLISPRKVI